jgi:hypothetical protein
MSSSDYRRMAIGGGPTAESASSSTRPFSYEPLKIEKRRQQCFSSCYVSVRIFRIGIGLPDSKTALEH